MSSSVPYLAAGFVLTWGVVLLYAWRLESRLDDARSRMERRGRAGSRVQSPGAATGSDEPSGAGPEEER